jgi:murein DD-endopeptidase MepM/ murein hydrolase activator NlpD
MAVFRGTDRIRRAAAAAWRSLRHVRSSSLKGITIVENKIMPNVSRLIRNYRAPVTVTALAFVAVSAVGLGGQQYVKAHTIEYYQVYVNGAAAGDISSRDKVEQWLAAKSVELDRADNPVREVLDKDQVRYIADKGYKKRTDDNATIAQLEDRIATHPVGVQLIVEGRLVGIVRDRATAETLLKKVKNKYVPATSFGSGSAAPKNVQTSAKKSAPQVQTLALSAASGKSASAVPKRLVTSVEFIEEVDLAEVEITAGQLSDPDKLYQELVTGNPTDVTYTVKDGDCLGCVASKMNVSPELIYERNPWIEDDLLHIGDTLDLTEVKPLLNVKSVEQVTQIEPIEPKVEYRVSDDMRVGKTQVLRQGKEGQKRVTYRLVKKNGDLMEEEIVTEQVLQQAVSTIILKGSKVIAGEGTGKFSWPVIGHRITSYMGKRWGRMHKGIDIIGRSSIMAADNGVIEYAGYKSGGMGNMVVIDHKNGFKTVYGHMKTVKVKKGQTVEKSDTLGVMGSTGHSTGTHLHFEIYQNGKLKNPTSFL